MSNIDFVITWVDGSDNKWLAERNLHIDDYVTKYQDIAGDSRYRDNGLLRYWFRGVEKFAPWVNKIYFVTYGHTPSWLNVNHQKLVVVEHKDFIPNEYLPTFNSNTITLNLHRIENLSEHFVYFNDDMFLVSPCDEKDFFKNNLPRDMAIQDVIPAVDSTEYWHMYFNIITLLNKNFNKRRFIIKNFNKWFSFIYGKQVFKNLLLTPFSLLTGIYETHTPNSYLKSSYINEWNINQQIFDETSKHKVRNYKDVTEWYIRYAQMLKGDFVPINKFKIGRYLTMKNNNIYNIILSGKYKYLCINDEVDGNNYSKVCAAFDMLLPNTSEYEK